MLVMNVFGLFKVPLKVHQLHPESFDFNNILSCATVVSGGLPGDFGEQGNAVNFTMRTQKKSEK